MGPPHCGGPRIWPPQGRPTPTVSLVLPHIPSLIYPNPRTQAPGSNTNLTCTTVHPVLRCPAYPASTPRRPPRTRPRAPAVVVLDALGELELPALELQGRTSVQLPGPTSASPAPARTSPCPVRRRPARTRMRMVSHARARQEHRMPRASLLPPAARLAQRRQVSCAADAARSPPLPVAYDDVHRQRRRSSVPCAGNLRGGSRFKPCLE